MVSRVMVLLGASLVLLGVGVVTGCWFYFFLPMAGPTADTSGGLLGDVFPHQDGVTGLVRSPCFCRHWCG